MLPPPSLLTTVVAFLLVLGPLIVIHELGHYLVGRLFGVKVDAFSIGFGKELLGRTDKRGTRWKLSAIPLGGYVQFAGDWNALSAPDKASGSLTPSQRQGVFHFKPLWQRALIVAAGPLTNLFLAIAVYTGFNMAYGIPVTSTEIARFAPGSAAEAAGLKVGDRIVAVDGSAIGEFTDVALAIIPWPGKTVDIAVERGGRQLHFPVKIAEIKERDQFRNEQRIGRIGIMSARTRLERLGPVDASVAAMRQTGSMVGMIVTGIRQIVSGDRSIRELGGPIKIARISGEQISLGWLNYVNFVALISINLAFINLLPIPGLDGGHLAFYAAEAVRRKPLGQRSHEWALRVGMAFVLALMVFVTVNDVVSLPVFGR